MGSPPKAADAATRKWIAIGIIGASVASIAIISVVAILTAGEERAETSRLVFSAVLPLLWHPMLYHYGRNWKVPADGEYTLHVRVKPPTFMRHDDVNGRRFRELVECTFENVQVERGQD